MASDDDSVTLIGHYVSFLLRYRTSLYMMGDCRDAALIINRIHSNLYKYILLLCIKKHKTNMNLVTLESFFSISIRDCSLLKMLFGIWQTMLSFSFGFLCSSPPFSAVRQPMSCVKRNCTILQKEKPPVL